MHKALTVALTILQSSSAGTLAPGRTRTRSPFWSAAIGVLRDLRLLTGQDARDFQRMTGPGEA
jgi:hypothetical protein